MSSSAACANASMRLVQLRAPLLYVIMLPDLARAEGSASSGQQVFAISREFRANSSIAANRRASWVRLAR